MEKKLIKRTRNAGLIEKIAQKYSIELILLFGSRASGKAREESDYDIAYLSKRHLSLSEEGSLIIKLAPLFSIPFDKIELTPIRNASPFFLKEIFSNAQILYAKDDVIFDQYKLYALRLFEESQFIFKNIKKILGIKVDKYKKELLLNKK